MHKSISNKKIKSAVVFDSMTQKVLHVLHTLPST